MINSIPILIIINTMAIIFIPIIAVLIGSWLQKREKQRDDKMQIFRILMTYRFYGWTNESVYA